MELVLFIFRYMLVVYSRFFSWCLLVLGEEVKLWFLVSRVKRVCLWIEIVMSIGNVERGIIWL